MNIARVLCVISTSLSTPDVACDLACFRLPDGREREKNACEK